MLVTTKPTSLSPYSDLYDLLIPKDHKLRRINETVDLSFLNEALFQNYCLDNGRTSEPPATMGRYLLLKGIYQLSDRDLVSRCRTDMAFKWFLGLNPEDEVIHASTLSKFRTMRLKGTNLLDILIQKSVEVAVEKGVLNPSAMIIVDGTHCKAHFRLMTPSEYLMLLAKGVRQALYSSLDEKKWKKVLPSKISSTKLRDIIAYCKSLVDVVRMIPNIIYYDNVITKVNFLDEKTADIEELLRLALEEARAEERKKVKAGEKNAHADEKIEKKAQREAGKVMDYPLEAARINKYYSFDEGAKVGHKTSDSSFFGYKIHLAMSDNRIVTAATVTAGQTNEGAQLKELVHKTRENGMDGKVVIGDTAYSGRNNLKLARSTEDPDGNFTLVSKLNPVISAATVSQERNGFTLNKDSGLFVCPNGHMAVRKKLINRDKEGKNSQEFHYFDVSKCVGCPYDGTCHKRGARTKSYAVTIPSGIHKEQQEFQSSEEFQKAMAHRYKIEAKNSELKHRYGLDTAISSGLFAMQVQGAFAIYAANLMRIATLVEAKEAEK